MNETFNNCPKCYCTHFVKAGLGNGKQRYKCKGYHHYFFCEATKQQKKVMALKKQAIDTNSKQILGFVCGKTDTNTFKRLYQQLNTHNIQLFF